MAGYNYSSNFSGSLQKINSIPVFQCCRERENKARRFLNKCGFVHSPFSCISALWKLCFHMSTCVQGGVPQHHFYPLAAMPSSTPGLSVGTYGSLFSHWPPGWSWRHGHSQGQFHLHSTAWTVPGTYTWDQLNRSEIVNTDLCKIK